VIGAMSGLAQNIILRTSADDVSHLMNALAYKPASVPHLDRSSLETTPASRPLQSIAGKSMPTFTPLLKPSAMPTPASLANNPLAARVIVHQSAQRNFSRSHAGLMWSSSRDQLQPRAFELPREQQIAPTYRDLTYQSSSNLSYRPPATANIKPAVFNHHRVLFSGGPPEVSSSMLPRGSHQPFVTPFSASPRNKQLDFGNTYHDNIQLFAYGHGYGYQN